MSKPATILAREPSFEVVDVTPKLAEQWLGKNGHNRNIRPAAVNIYAADMVNGRWRFNGEAIKFNTEGELADGQHRLMAVIAAGVTVPMLVGYDLSPESQETMDSGVKRTAGDVLRLRGYMNYVVLSAVANRVLLWQRGVRWSRNRLSMPSKAELVQAIETDPTIIEATHVADRCRKWVQAPTSVIGTCWWVFAHIDREQADDFFDKLQTGADLPAHHPILTLRNRLSQVRNAPGQWLSTERYIALFCRCWNAYRQGRTLQKLAISTGKPGADGEEVFPEPK